MIMLYFPLKLGLPFDLETIRGVYGEWFVLLCGGRPVSNIYERLVIKPLLMSDKVTFSKGVQGLGVN